VNFSVDTVKHENIAAADRFGKVLAKIDADGQANHEPPG
jgi:hypothetical protein